MSAAAAAAVGVFDGDSGLQGSAGSITAFFRPD